MMGLKRFFGLAMSLAVLTGSPALGQDAASRPLGVVELFTSQGCNSCPKADAVLADLAQRGDVVALAYHVDYWDYLGWKDTLASPENTQRQSDYARSLGLRSVYTPQAVVNGRTHLNGGKGRAIEAGMREMQASGEGLAVDVGIRIAGDTLLIDIGERDAGKKTKAHVALVFFNGVQSVAISRGENAGKNFVYRNAVTGVQTAGMYHGKAARLEIPASELRKNGATDCAVLVQSFDASGNPGPILGAAILPRPSS